jgi:hypothetical protein
LNGEKVLARAFTAELLGRWLSANPRALVMCFMTEAEAMNEYTSYLEVRGEVLSIGEPDIPLAGRKKVRLQDGYGGLTAFDLMESEIAERGVRRGVSVTVLGTPHFSHRGFTIGKPQVTVN